MNPSYLLTAAGIDTFHGMVLQNLPESQSTDAKVCIEMQDQEIYFIERPPDRKNGMNIFTGDNVAFKLSMSILPDHFAISLATTYVALDDIPGLSILFSDAYSMYFSKVTAILRYAST